MDGLRIAAAAFVAVLLFALMGNSSVSADPESRERLFEGSIGTKLNAMAQGPLEYDVTTTEPDAQTFTSVVVAAVGAPAPGALAIDTSDTTTWKAPTKTGSNTWTVTTKATSATSAGVYINGAFRPLLVGSKITVKFVGVLRGSLYVKVAGMAPNGAGATKVGVEAETKGLGLDGELFVVVVNPHNGAILDPSATLAVGFNEGIDFVDANLVHLVCTDGSTPTDIPITVTWAQQAMFADPVGLLPAGQLCTLTVEALAPSDADSIDPPTGMQEDFSITYAVDVP